MATSNKMRALNRLPFDFEDGLKIGGVDVTQLKELSTSAGASKIGYMPAGGGVATTVESKLRSLELADYAALRAFTGSEKHIQIVSPGIAGLFYYDASDTTSTDNGGTIIVAGTKRWKRMFEGAVNVKWFGAKCNGTADDTVPFKAAIEYVKTNFIKLEFAGRMRITDEITLERTIWFEGSGESAGATIIFDNAEVDDIGNATKCLFRFKGTYPYGLYNSKLKNFSVSHNSQVPKNQHCIIFDRTYIINLVLDNINVTNATGYIIYLIGDGVNNYVPGFHHPAISGIRGWNVGGIFGQATSAKTWIVAGDFSMLNLEQKINPVSPGTIMCDFSGARYSVFKNFIMEGAGNASSTTVFKFTTSDNVVEAPWIEITTNPPVYDFDTVDALEIRKYFGAGKIKAAGESAIVRVTGISELNTSSPKFELSKGATVDCSESYSSYYWATDRPHVLLPQAGKIKYHNHRTAAGGSYSHDYSLELLKLDRAKSLIVSDNNWAYINSYVRYCRTHGGHGWDCVPALDPTEGRILQFTSTSGGYKFPAVTFQVMLPTEFVGCSVVFGIRYSVSTVETTGSIAIPEYKSGSANNVTASNLPNVVTINTRMKPTDYGKYKNAYVVVNETTGNVSFTLVETNTAAPLSVSVSDIQIFIGNNLPSLRGYNRDAYTWRDAAVPTVGYYVTGDLIINTGSLSSTNGWRRKTTGTDNALGVDWIAF